MPRTMLTDKWWEKLLQIMKNTGRVYNKSEHRMTFEGSLFRMKTGIPWRDLPEEFGEWSTVYRRFNLWSKKGILVDIFKHLSQLPDFEWVFLDSSIIRVHQHSTGAATEHSEQIGQSCGGHSTKIHLAVDSGGLPICFELSEGQRHDYGKDIDKSSMDRCLYRYRHLVENAFARIKQYRSISTRYDKLERNYASMVSLAFMLMWLPMYC